MRFFRSIAKTIEKTSPLGLLLAGSAIVMTAPTLKQAVRGTAVAVTRGAMQMSAAGVAIGHEMRENWEDIVAEARNQKSMIETQQMERGTILGAGAGGAVGAGLGGNLGGGMGAAVGGGIGSVIGAGIGSSIGDHSSSKSGTVKTDIEESKEIKNVKKNAPKEDKQ